MTFQPPPPPPPSGSPPPPAGGWGPPPEGTPANFDPKAVNPLDWAIVGAGVLAFLFSFIAFYDGADVTAGGHSTTVDTLGTYSAWHDVIGGGFFSWFAMVFAVAGAAAVALGLFAPHVRLPVANRLAGLGLFAAATVFEIIGIFVTPGDSGGVLGRNVDLSLNHGFGFWVSLIVILVGLVLSLMRLQATGGQLPGGLGGRVPNIGGYGPQDGISGGASRPPSPGPGQNPPPPPTYGPPR
ncbi:MAG: hypothetical protein ACR2LX_14465 [Jatrophihabitans sp.]